MNPDPNQSQEPTPGPAPDATPTPFEQPAQAAATPPVEAPAQYTESPTTPADAAFTSEAPAFNPFGNAGETPIEVPVATSGEVVDQAPTSVQGQTPTVAAPVSTDPTAATPFAQPVGTPTQTSTEVPTGVPVKKSKKKLIILLSAIIGGLIILAGAALAVYLLFFAVTKADYQKAYDQVSAVRDKYSTGDSITSGSSKETVDAAKTAYADFKTENAKLADLRALKNDKDLKAKYDAYETKVKAYTAFGDVFIPSLDRFVGAADQVSALGTGADAFTSANIQKTIDIYKGIDDIADPTLKAFVDSTISAYEEILPQAKIYESTSATSAQKLAAISAISDSGDKISSAANKLSDELDAKVKAVSLDDSLNELGKAVTAKLNAAK